MPEINISNAAGRDAVVNMESVAAPLRVRWIDGNGRQARSIRFLKSTIDHDIDALVHQYEKIENVGPALIDSDPEIDFESTGSFLNMTSRVYVDQDRELVHRIQQFDVIVNPDGTQRERRPRETAPQNVSSEIPLNWSGIFIKKSEVVRKFIFANKMQLMHINGLTYDFLFGMAKDLEDRKSMMLLGGGSKNNQPLILRRGSVPYRGFLEGRTRGDKYVLLLHLSNLEMKTPDATEGEN
ncbi:MAG: hypothetical protein AAF456_20550 [Planctomycetota bacterium]